MKIKRKDMPTAPKSAGVYRRPAEQSVRFAVPVQPEKYKAADCKPSVSRHKQQLPKSQAEHRQTAHPARSVAADVRRKNQQEHRNPRRRHWMIRSVSVLVTAFALTGILRNHVMEQVMPVNGNKNSHQSVELLYQNPELPNGCEVTSLAMALNAAGCPVDKVALYQECLPCEAFSYSGNDRFGPDPEKFYAGDAASERGGWYCFEDPIVQAARTWIRQSQNQCTVQKVSGISERKVRSYAEKEIPLVVWVTQDYEMPYQSSFTWTLPGGGCYEPYGNLHCVVLAGMEGSNYRIADPLRGWQTVDPQVFWDSFDAMGRRAVCIK